MPKLPSSRHAPKGKPPRSSTRDRASSTATRAPQESGDKDGRARIIAVAIRSFSDRGYEGTTTAGVAREAGVTQPLIHHHFGSKEGLWRAAMDELFAVATTFTAANGKSTREALLDTAERFVRFVAARPEVTRIIAREGAAHSPRLTYLVDHYLRAPFRNLVDLVRAGQRAGVLTSNMRPELLLFFILGAGSHLFDVTALADESLDIDATTTRVREDFVALVREVLGGGLFRRL